MGKKKSLSKKEQKAGNLTADRRQRNQGEVWKSLQCRAIASCSAVFLQGWMGSSDSSVRSCTCSQNSSNLCCLKVMHGTGAGKCGSYGGAMPHYRHSWYNSDGFTHSFVPIKICSYWSGLCVPPPGWKYPPGCLQVLHDT